MECNGQKFVCVHIFFFRFYYLRISLFYLQRGRFSFTESIMLHRHITPQWTSQTLALNRAFHVFYEFCSHCNSLKEVLWRSAIKLAYSKRCGWECQETSNKWTLSWVFVTYFEGHNRNNVTPECNTFLGVFNISPTLSKLFKCVSKKLFKFKDDRFIVFS